MASTSREYQMKVCGFTQSSVITSVKRILNDALEKAVESIFHKMANKYDGDTVKQFTTRLLSAYRTSIDQHTSELEKIIGEYFAIVPEMALPEESKMNSAGGSDVADLVRKIEVAQKKLDALALMETKLRELVNKIATGQGMIIELQNLENIETPNADLLEAVEQSAITSIMSALNLNG